jgi:hypothetical protein
MHVLLKTALLLLALNLAGCGGGSGGGAAGSGGGAPAAPTLSPTTNNVIATPAYNVVALNISPSSGNVNILWASITICVPGTTTCQIIPNMLVDTGSSGIRILSSALPTSFALPQETGSGGGPVAECAQFASGYTWGAIKTADIKIGGEQAVSLPVQVIDDVGATAVPAACSATGASVGTAANLSANGILGISNLINDFGSYFECPLSGCVAMAEPSLLQVRNPVPAFSMDSNGFIIELPSIPSTGAGSVTGALVFGIGTNTNNSLGAASVIPLDSFGNLTTVYKGANLPNSFLDSGSNLMIFQDAGIPLCAAPYATMDCPASTLMLNASIHGVTGAAVTVNFSVANANALIATGNTTFNNLAATSASITSFDWGLPFFLGKNIYFAISAASTTSGNGPYIAF